MGSSEYRLGGALRWANLALWMWLASCGRSNLGAGDVDVGPHVPAGGDVSGGAVGAGGAVGNGEAVGNGGVVGNGGSTDSPGGGGLGGSPHDDGCWGLAVVDNGQMVALCGERCFQGVCQEGVTLAMGGRRSCVLAYDGRVSCWGRATQGYGDLEMRGDGSHELPRGLPPVDLARPAQAIAVGSGHLCALLDDGSVQCWGNNGVGQLGLGDTEDRGDEHGEMGHHLPVVDLGTARFAMAITAGDSHTCALLDEGSVKCWGYGWHGQLGHGKRTNVGDAPDQMGDQLPPVDLGTDRTALAIGAGGDTTCAILDDHSLKCWGLNSSGQLGLGDAQERGSRVGDMGNALPAVNLGSGVVAAAVSVGRSHVCALLQDDSLKCWGLNSSGQLGLGDGNTRGRNPDDMGDNLPAVDLGSGALAVRASDASSCALLTAGTVKCWGDNQSGTLGQGDAVRRGTTAESLGDHLLPIATAGGQAVRALEMGGASVCVLLEAGGVQCWGDNTFGTLGLGDRQNRGDEPGEMGDALPVLLNLFQAEGGPCGEAGARVCNGAAQSKVLVCDGSQWVVAAECAGGSLCDQETATCAPVLEACLSRRAPYLPMCLDSRVVRCGYDAVSVETLETCPEGCQGASCGSASCGNGVLEAGEACDDANDVAGDGCHRCDRVIQVAVASDTSCARTALGHIKCWSSSNPYHLGDELYGDRPEELSHIPFFEFGSRATSLDVGASQTSSPSDFACASFEDGSIKCWGNNQFGQLGLGQLQDWNRPYETAPELPAVDLGAGALATKVVTGGAHACALLSSGGIKCWGANGMGQLGLGDVAHRGRHLGDMGDALPFVDLGDDVPVIALSAGQAHTCALRLDGTIKCWGGNRYGQLGLEDTEHRGNQPGEMGAALPLVNLGTGARAIAVVAGSYRTCALLEDGSARCWGENSEGQLGLGDRADRGDEPGEMGDHLPRIDFGGGARAVDLSVGWYHTCAALSEGSVKCWGYAGAGQLGLESTERQTRAEDALPAVPLGSGLRASAVFAGGQRTCVLLGSYQVKCWGQPGIGLGLGGIGAGSQLGSMGDALSPLALP